MAVTKIWKINRSFADPIDYVKDPEKTKNPKRGRSGQSEQSRQMLEDVIEYAANEDKTEKKYFVSGINCDRDHARDEFLMTKKRFGKEDGIVAYHAYQSFEEPDITPELAHEIGIAFAKEIWGGRFQVVVATHLNTDHVHNHFIVNSVSFKDGNKYHDSRTAYRRMREVSDRLCREHGLSVIEHPEGRGGSYYLNSLEKAGMPTRFNVARAAIDEAIASSVNMEEFKQELRRMGYRYQFSPNRKYWTVTPAGWEKPIRLHRLGADYTRERIEQRVYENDISVRTERLTRLYYHRPNSYSLHRRIDRIMGRTGLEKLYLRYCYELGYLPKYTQKPSGLHPLLKEDLLKCEMYSEEAKLLCRNHISTEADLLSYADGLTEKMKDIEEKRGGLRAELKRGLPEDEQRQTRAEIAALSDEMKELRKEARLCGDIKERSQQVEQNMDVIDKERRQRKEVRKR